MQGALFDGLMPDCRACNGTRAKVYMPLGGGFTGYCTIHGIKQGALPLCRLTLWTPAR